MKLGRYIARDYVSPSKPGVVRFEANDVWAAKKVYGTNIYFQQQIPGIDQNTLPSVWSYPLYLNLFDSEGVQFIWDLPASAFLPFQGYYGVRFRPRKIDISKCFINRLIPSFAGQAGSGLYVEFIFYEKTV